MLLVATLLRSAMRTKLTTVSRYLAQNTIISLLGTYVALTDPKYGVSWALLTTTQTLVQPAAKLVTMSLFLGMYVWSDESFDQSMRLGVSLLAVVGTIMLELKRYASFQVEFRQLQRSK
jgi:hypothetical protein